MIKDKRDSELTFKDAQTFIDYLDIDSDIANDCTLSLENCESEQDFCDFANEYELKMNDGMMVHEWITF